MTTTKTNNQGEHLKLVVPDVALDTLSYQVRRAYNWTQKELSEHMRSANQGPCNTDTIRRWERGVQPAPHYRHELERLLRVAPK